MTDLPEWAKELVEPVARAIYDRKHEGLMNCYAWDESWEPYQEHGREQYLKDATAALAIALPKIAEHFAGVAERGGQDIAPTDALPAGWMVATSYVATAIRREVTLEHKP